MKQGVSLDTPAADRRSRFALLPADERQRLRVRRFLIASGTSLLLCLVLYVCGYLGVLPMRAAERGAAGIVALIVVFYVLFRSGVNLRFADPSLTSQQMGAAILFLAYFMYYAESVRSELSLFYLVALQFGMLRLGTRRLLLLAGFALVVHGAMLGLWHAGEPAANAMRSAAQFAVLLIVLPWFAAMSGYVNSLRQGLSDSNRHLREANLRVEQIAMRDELTGAFNRRSLMATLEREISRAQRLGTQLCVCLFDIDHFKRINDRWGHATGDAVLRQFALIAGTKLRGADVFGRYGGEEFLLILPDTDARGAVLAAERIREDVGRTDFPQLPRDHHITVTGGVAAWVRRELVSEFLKRADAGLYQGKEAGRNRVVAVG
jgi:diguanylate cyclase (GGDEF)-like protein